MIPERFFLTKKTQKILFVLYNFHFLGLPNLLGFSKPLQNIQLSNKEISNTQV